MLNKGAVDDLKDLKGKKVLVRCNFSVSLKEGATRNCNRIDGAISTIKKLPDQGAKVIFYSHLGKPKGKLVLEINLASIVPVLGERLGVEVKFADDAKVTGPKAQKVATELKDGEVFLLQGTRYRIEETKFEDNDATAEAYAKELVDLCNDIFVNDAFGTIYRAHCSNVSVIRYTKKNMVSYLMEKETKFLGQAVESPVRPFVAILGGAKVSDKINVVSNLLGKADTLIIGGGMAYIFAKAQGQETGSSLCEEDKLDYALEMVRKTEGRGIKLPLLADHIEGKELSNEIEHKVVDVIDVGWSGFDIGPKTITLYKDVLKDTRTAVWNGPMDVFEFSNFVEGTLEVCRVVADLADTTTVIGGGNSVNTVKRLGFASKMTYIFTGGSASLESLEGKELPGVAAAGNKG